MRKKDPNKPDLAPPTSIRLQRETHEALRRLAEREKRTLNNYLNVILDDHVSAVESGQQRAA